MSERIWDGPRGSRSITTPNGASASATALTTAGGAPMAAALAHALVATGARARRLDVAVLDHRDLGDGRQRGSP